MPPIELAVAVFRMRPAGVCLTGIIGITIIELHRSTRLTIGLKEARKIRRVIDRLRYIELPGLIINKKEIFSRAALSSAIIRKLSRAIKVDARDVRERKFIYIHADPCHCR